MANDGLRRDDGEIGIAPDSDTKTGYDLSVSDLKGAVPTGDPRFDIDVKTLLGRLATQLADSDRRHSAALQDLQTRVAHLSHEEDAGRAVQPGQPEDCASSFERLELQIMELADRLGRTAFQDDHAAMGQSVGVQAVNPATAFAPQPVQAEAVRVDAIPADSAAYAATDDSAHTAPAAHAPMLSPFQGEAVGEESAEPRIAEMGGRIDRDGSQEAGSEEAGGESLDAVYASIKRAFAP